jgi:ubiquinone/menaquinone biosynthesis C-methylase UbiE
LDALAALGLLDKREQSYTVPEPLRPLLVEGSSRTLLPMVRHMMCVLRSWSQLAAVVRSGKPAARQASIRGAEADRAAFIAAMHSVSAPAADELVGRLMPLGFEHLLDVGGASGTWTLALLRAVPQAKATIFDLPDAIDQARQRIGQTEFASRVRLTAGDFYADELPGGADFAWVSAIAHQHDRGHNRDLFAKVFRALVPGGRIGIRDVLMDPARTRPVDGALFAVNMLVNTETGGTFTFDEFRDDLQAAGFIDAAVKVRSEDMNCVVLARKP